MRQNITYDVDRATEKRHEIILRNNKIFTPVTLIQLILKWHYENL